MKSPFRKTWNNYVEHEIALVSAALAFYTLLAVVPVMGLGLWYLEKIGVAQRWVVLTRQYILEHLNVSFSAVFLNRFDEFTSNMKGMSWGWVGFTILIYTSVSVVSKFGRGLDAVMSESSELKGDFSQRLKVWIRRTCGIMGLPLALAISLGVSQSIKQLGPFLHRPVSWGVTIVSVFFVYYFIPSRRVGIKSALYLAVVVGPVLELLRLMLGFYARSALSAKRIYGVFAVIPLLIVWIQLSWAVLLLGAVWLKAKVKK